MKKIVSILIIIAIILISNISLGDDSTNKNIELTLNGPTTIKADAKTVELTISIGKFTGIEENAVLAYETILEYDTKMFKSAKVEGQNGWNASYTESTKKILGDTSSAKANTQVAKITLTLNDGVKGGDSGTVKLTAVDLSDDTTTLNKNKELSATITVEKDPEPEQPAEEPKNEEQPKTEQPAIAKPTATATQTTPASTTKTESSTTKNTDNTTTGKVIPKTGSDNAITFA